MWNREAPHPDWKPGQDWGQANKGVSPEQVLEQLRPLLELPVELVLPAYGAPAGRAAPERALA